MSAKKKISWIVGRGVTGRRNCVSSGRCPWRGGVWVEMWITIRRQPGRNLWAHCPGWRGSEAGGGHKFGWWTPRPVWPEGGGNWGPWAIRGQASGRTWPGLYPCCSERPRQDLSKGETSSGFCFSIVAALLESPRNFSDVTPPRPPSDQLHQKGLVLMGAKSRGDGLRQPHGAEWGQTQIGTGPLPINRRAELLFIRCFCFWAQTPHTFNSWWLPLKNWAACWAVPM